MRGMFQQSYYTSEQMKNPAVLMHLVELPDPPLGPKEVRIAVKATGVNFADALLMQGKYQEKPAFPFAPGFEVAGEVIEIGRAVTSVQVGQNVWGVVDHGGYADRVVARQDDLMPLPEMADGQKLDPIIAASLPIAYGTSHFALIDRAGLRAGDWVLVHGAAGGVGLTAVECAKAAGARVIATARGADRLQVVRDHGADAVLDSLDFDGDAASSFRDAVKDLTGGAGVDIVYDPVGGVLAEQSLRCLGIDGRLLLIGFAGGSLPVFPPNHLLVKNVSIIGFYWGAYRRHAPHRVQSSFAQIGDWLKNGLLRPTVSQTFALADAAQALNALRHRSITGKAVIRVSE